MEWLQWLQAHVYALYIALGSIALGLLSAVTTVGNVLNGINTIRSFATAFIQWLQRKSAGPDKSLTNSGDQPAQSDGTESAGVEERASSENRPGPDMNLDQPILFFLVNNIVNTVVNTMDRDTKKRRARRGTTTRQPTRQSTRDKPVGEPLKDYSAAPAGSLSPPDATGDMEGSAITPSTSVGGSDSVASTESEPPSSIRTVPVLTPREAQPQSYGKSEDDILSPATTGGGNPDPARDTARATINSKGADVTPWDPAPSESDPPVSLDSAVVSDSAESEQSCVKETDGSTHEKADRTMQTSIESHEPESQSIADEESVVTTKPEAITESPASQHPDESVDTSLSSDSQAEPTQIDMGKDIADISIGWSAAVIGDTLQRLRRARGLSRTDLSYDPGWVMAFEAGCWHTYETDRRCFVRAILAYLQALGMTTVELRACLPQQDTDE